MVQLNKLPEIIELNKFGGNYRLYIDAVYEVFLRISLSMKHSLDLKS